MSEASKEQQLQNCAEWNMQMRDRHMKAANQFPVGVILSPTDRITVQEHMRSVHRHQRNIDSLNAQLREFK